MKRNWGHLRRLNKYFDEMKENNKFRYDTEKERKNKKEFQFKFCAYNIEKTIWIKGKLLENLFNNFSSVLFSFRLTQRVKWETMK